VLINTSTLAQRGRWGASTLYHSLSPDLISYDRRMG
jgi:hypothetical protein